MIEVGNGKKVGFVGKDKIYIGRKSYAQKGSLLANKFKIGRDGNRDEVVEKYRRWLWNEYKKKGEVYKELWRIANKVKKGEKVQLMCWCAPYKCHGDVVKRCIEWMIRDVI